MKNRSGEEKQDTLSRQPWNGNSSQAVRTHKAQLSSKEQMGRRRSTTRGFLRKCQPPACQGKPGGNNRQERKDAVSGQQDGKHREDYREGKHGHKRRTKKKNSAVLQKGGGKKQWCLGKSEHIVPSHAWQNDVKASVNNAWQISPFCRTPLVGAFVLDGTKGYHDKLPAQRQKNTVSN